jgi:hypothetical protein
MFTNIFDGADVKWNLKASKKTEAEAAERCENYHSSIGRKENRLCLNIDMNLR